jgi:DNA repair protein RadD
MTAPLILRPYQLDAVDALRKSYASGHRAVILQSATGSGKTVIFAEITRGATAKGTRTLVLVHRRHLIWQASAKLTWAGVPHGIIAAGYPPSPDETVQVASVQTVVNHLDEIGQFDLVVIDECHHAVAETWAKVLASQPHAKLLGVTATPARLDGKGLGVTYGGWFDHIVFGAPIRELQEWPAPDGPFLSKARYFVPGNQAVLDGLEMKDNDFIPAQAVTRVDKPVITGDAVEKYRELAAGRPAIAFCTLVRHAENVAGAFREAGFRSDYVDGKTSKREQARLIAGLGNGEIEVLTSCDLISEGLDVPALGAVILLRPTASLVMFMQQVGRGMRYVEDKPPLVVVDHVGNIARHGLPETPRKWSLAGVEKEDKSDEYKICPRCQYVNEKSALFCTNCNLAFEGHGYGGGREIPPQVDGPLVEISEARKFEIIRMSDYEMKHSNLSEAELGIYAAQRGYKPGWVYYRLKAMGKKPGAASGLIR